MSISIIELLAKLSATDTQEHVDSKSNINPEKEITFSQFHKPR